MNEKISEKKLVSIVVTTKNEEFHIENCLRAIFNQKLSTTRIEVIVVDNFSTDRTKELAKKFPIRFFSVGPERNVQRNFGMLQQAKGEYLVWIDADHIIHPLLIEQCTIYMESNKEISALMVPEIILGTSYFSRVRRFERQFYEGTVIDGSRFIRAAAFISAGGFSSEWLHGPDDWDLDLKLSNYGPIRLLKKYGECGNKFEKFMNEEFKLDPKDYPIGKFHNESTLTLKRHLKKKIHYSSDFQKYIDYWGNTNPSVRKQVGISYRYFGVFFENKKWKLVLKHPILYLSVLLNKFLTGIVYIVNR